MSTIFLSNSAKYWLATVGFAVTFFFALAYFWELTTAPHPASADLGLLLEGAVLFIAATATILVRAYYRKDRFAVGVPSDVANEVSALGLLGRERLKPVSITLTVTGHEYAQLAQTGKLQLALSRFHQPIRPQDTVHVCTGAGSLAWSARTLITEIDGVNQTAHLVRVWD